MLRINHKYYGIILAEPVRNYIHNDIEFMTVILQTKIRNAYHNKPRGKSPNKGYGHNVGNEFDILVSNIENMIEV